MRYLQIPDDLVNRGNNLYELIWPEDATLEYNYIYHKNVFLVKESHPNIAFILMKLSQHDWYDDDAGPVKFVDWLRYSHQTCG